MKWCCNNSLRKPLRLCVSVVRGCHALATARVHLNHRDTETQRFTQRQAGHHSRKTKHKNNEMMNLTLTLRMIIIVILACAMFGDSLAQQQDQTRGLRVKKIEESVV